MAEFPTLDDPKDLAEWIFSDGLDRSGFQGAHTIGDAFWKNIGNALSLFGIPSEAVDQPGFNGALLSNEPRASAILGTATHANHTPEFNKLFWNSDYLIGGTGSETSPIRPGFLQYLIEKFTNENKTIKTALDSNEIDVATYSEKPHHPSVFTDQSGGRGKTARMRRAMYRNPLVKKDVLERARFFG